jgi:hypothetical protein
MEITQNSIEISGTSTLQTRRGRAEIGCVLTEDGVKNFETSNREAQFCIAEDPYNSFERGMGGGRSKIAVVPKEIADSTLVRLYLMNGEGIDYAEPVEEGSNGYVRMWEVNLENNN